MSVEWERYSTPHETRQRASEPMDNAVVRLPVIGIRDITPLDVKHTPKATNRAHSDVLSMPDGGEDLTEIRISLLDICKVVISL